MTTPTPPMLNNVRGFKDEPTVKLLDSSNLPERVALVNYLKELMPESMYTHGNFAIEQVGGGLAGHAFMSDSLKFAELAKANPVSLDAASQTNGNWQYCYLHYPHIRTTKSVNVIIFPDQEYVVTNEGSSPFYVYIRRYNKQGGHSVGKPQIVNSGQTIRV